MAMVLKIILCQRNIGARWKFGSQQHHQ